MRHLLNYSIAHGTILNPTVDSKGNFKGLLFDKYDFALMMNYYKNFKTALYNNYGWYEQTKFFKKPNYYVFVPVIFKGK